MRFVKRILCLFLILPCVLFTGCNSIILKGDLSVKNYEPSTLPVAISDHVEQKVEEAEETFDYEKYQIEGLNAFYILPSHENKPDEMVDFKVLDYQEDVGFIYAYKTPYYGPDDESEGLTVSAVGDVGDGEDLETRTATETQDTSLLVTVLMSYRPDTGAYHVFFTCLESGIDTETVEKEVDEKLGTISGSVMENRLMAQKLSGQELYFLYQGNIGHLFNPQGEEVWSYDYNIVVNQEVEKLIMRHAKSGYTANVTISDVVMDGARYLYIPIAVELEKEGDDGIDLDSLSENDKELESNSFRAVLCCYNVNVGGNNQENIRFTSTNENWERQRAAWLEYDGVTFSSREDMEAYQEDVSMDRLKTGAAGDCEDRFTYFYTAGNALNLELWGVPDIFEVYDDHLSDWIFENYDLLIQHGTEDYLMRRFGWNYRVFWSIFSFLHYRPFYQPRAFWNSLSQEEREEWYYMVKTAMALYFQEEGGIRIPPMGMGAWSSRDQTNESPLSNFLTLLPYLQDTYALEALFAGKTTVYENGETETRLADIRIPGRMAGRDAQRPEIQVAEYTEPLTRTFYYEEEVETENEEGEKETEIITVEVTETTPSVPLTYELTLADDTMVFWIESEETDAEVIPSGSFGVLYLEDVSEPDTPDEESLSMAVYDDGQEVRPLEDAYVRGKITDGGFYYYDDTETAAVITSTGITFYQRSGQERRFDLIAYASSADLAQPSGMTISVAGGSSYLDTVSRAEVADVGEEQDAVIDEKLESGKDTEIYSGTDLAPLNRNEFVISTMYNGILLYNLRSGLSVSLEDGCYYASFPGKGSGQDRAFMVVGYQTDEYFYQPNDIAWAKCYEMDLAARGQELEKEAVKDYIDDLADAYLSRTHRVQMTEDGEGYVPVEPDEAEETANQQAETLFFGAEGSAESELRELIERMGFSIDFEELWEYTQQVREKLQNQRIALTELYALAGLGVISQTPADGNLLEIEGRLIRAPYTSNLENILVELALTDFAVDRIESSEERALYRGYQESQRELSGSMAVINSILKEGSGVSTGESGRLQASEQDVAKAQRALEESVFYQEVLADLQARYEEEHYGAEGQSWDSYMQEMLELASPDYSTNTREEGMREFCQAAGISEELTDLEELAGDLSRVYRVSELEELIIEYKVSGAAYQNTGYKQELQEYRDAHYDSEAERLAAFRGAGFYTIITNLQVQNMEYLEENDMTWEELLESIIQKCGSGIVLPSEAEEESNDD